MKNTQGNETPTLGNQVVSNQPVKVLLVDDRPDKLIALESILAGPALELVLAHSGKEALRLVLAHEFAVILLDVSMPIMDGFETASLIRQRKSSEHTPIIFITAYSDSEMPASRGYSLGAVDYIFAPVVPEILRAKVSVFIDLFKKAREAQRQGEWLKNQAERRASSLEVRLDNLLNQIVLDGRFDFHFRQEIDDVFRAAIKLRVALLAAEAFDFRDRDALHADGGQRFTHFVKLERLDDGGDQFHACSPLV